MMKVKQFDALCKIAGIGVSSKATRLAVMAVKMQSKSQKDAAALHGITPSNLSTAVKRFDSAVRLAYTAITGLEYEE